MRIRLLFYCLQNKNMFVYIFGVVCSPNGETVQSKRNVDEQQIQRSKNQKSMAENLRRKETKTKNLCEIQH